MAKLAFTTDNKREKFQSYPKIKLEKDERARVVCLEDPDVVFVHTLKKPELINGRPKMVTVKFQNGDEKEVNAMEFVASDLCLGSLEVLQKDGVDPASCPACARSKETDVILPPQRRFALHVAQYALKNQNAFAIADPFNVSIKAWTFNDRVFNELVEAVEIYGDLRKVDLAFGPCKNKMYQTFEIKVMPGSAEYLADNARKTNLIESFKNNKTDDLETLCGRKVEASLMSEHIAEVEARWRAARGENTVDLSSQVNTQSLDEGLLNLASGTPAADTPASETPLASVGASDSDGVVDLNALFDSL